MTWKDSVKIPIATLKEGVYQSSITGSFISYPPVTFSLVKGSGPVHIVGLHLVGSPIFEEEMDDMEEEMPDDEEGEEGDRAKKGRSSLENAILSGKEMNLTKLSHF
nr:unnamed protein product [Callosobruchus analis]CAI5837375.1 unnamed protein product [Callosobruchus analis]CAI5849088.1 unnamed protein product [Callosobruchus analis]CAI5853090.1 unnamed protein product [Callosobruchus analis]CAI5862714.1 unnamed protein product [Callosobruchus analis]